MRSEDMTLLDAWKAWRERPFPSEVSTFDTGEVDVVFVDTFAAGCLDTYFASGHLDDQRISVMEECVRDLHRTLPRLSGETSKYFAELAALCRRVLAAVGRRN